MRYKYGTKDCYTSFRGKDCSVKELASIIKRDVECGKWNQYEGGEVDSIDAHCRYKRNGFQYHEQLLIYGNKKEFKELEQLIDDIIFVNPRKF